jgi:eukaryotic-like serine/threonine-protein kinase
MDPPRRLSTPASDLSGGRALSELLAEQAPLDGEVAARLGVLLARALAGRATAPADLATSTRLSLGAGATPRIVVEEALGEARACEAAMLERGLVRAIGALLFEALSGRPALEAVEDPGALLRIAPWVERELAELVHSATRDAPDGIGSLDELAAALEPLACDEGSLMSRLAPSQETAPPDEVATRPATPEDDERPQAGDVVDAMLGRTLRGRYRLERLLGRGGMGAVFEATTTEGEVVAVKVLLPEAATRGTLRRFVREAKAAARIESPHVTKVIDASCDDSIPVLVMERMRGRDLAAVLDEVGALEPQIASRIAWEACLGLEAAHAAGLVHRDIKPSNLFLHEEEDGRLTVKVCDFGVAKLGPDTVGSETVLTRTGGLLGTPSYMPPEQAQDSRLVDARSDLWSLGATLYEMLGGRRPWHHAKNVGEVLAALYTREVPRLESIAPWVDLALADVVHACLRRDRDERLPSAAALRERLEPFAAKVRLRGERIRPLPEELRAESPKRSVRPEEAATTVGAASVERAPQRPRSGTRARLAALGSLVVLGGVAAAYGFRAVPTPAPTAPAPTCPGAKACSATLGEPARCGRDGACVALGSPLCTVEADAAAIESDRTVWIGAMFPADHDDTYTASFGKAAINAVSLAVREIQSVSGGVPGAGGEPVPLGLVACRDAKDPWSAARHLVDRVRVPAVIGFGSSKSVVELSTNLFLERDVLSIASINSSAMIASIPHAEGQPRLVYRTAANTATRAAALAKLVPDAIEPRLRSRRGAKTNTSDLRVALLTRHTAAGIAFADAVSEKLRFNGRSIRDNGAHFREVRLLGEDEATLQPDLAVADLVDLAPDLVIIQDTSDVVIGRVVSPLEDRWDTTRAPRPSYVVTGSLEDEAVSELLRIHPTVGTRLLGLTPPWQTPANSAFTRAYNAAFRESFSEAESPGAPYDSAYLVAYAIAGAEDPSSGASIARAFAKLLPPGPAIDVGPSRASEVFARVRRGAGVDLQGAFSRLDFDLGTGESPTDYTLVCGRLEKGKLTLSEAGAGYDAGRDEVLGSLRCGVAD